jgi:Protein of unknown function (DUF3126)
LIGGATPCYRVTRETVEAERIRRVGGAIRSSEHGSRRCAVDVQEVKKLDAYLKKLFGNARIRVVPRPKKDDSAEVYVGEEFVGVLFVDDEDDERSYNFQMAILGSDLE